MTPSEELDGLLSVLVPAFNEEATIAQCLERVLEHDFVGQVVVVDDGSSDLTSQAASSVLDPRVVVLTHESNQGKGAAIRTALRNATCPYVVIQDADLEYDPSDLELLLQPLVDGSADAVFGSRFISGEVRRVLYFWHSLGNRLLTLGSNMATNLNLSDMETCYKMFRVSAIRDLAIEESRFGIEPELTAKVASSGLRVCEVGISYRGRTYAEGKKIGWKDGVSALRCVVKYNWRERRRTRRSHRLSGNPAQESLHDSLHGLEATPNYNEWITKMLQPAIRGRILEVGAGQGTITSLVAGRGVEVCAVEPDPVLVARMRKRLESCPNVTVIHGTSSHDEVAAYAPYDGVIMVNVLEHIQDDVAELKALRRLMSPDAILAAFVPALEIIYSPFDREIGHYRRYSRRELNAKLSAAGFRNVELNYVNSVGALAWGATAGLLRLRPTSGLLAQTYDRHIVPRLATLESRHRVPVGQSIIALAQA